ncbi:hypothetical protein Q7P37_009478 [Cladosporium fusiforme]
MSSATSTEIEISSADAQRFEALKETLDSNIEAIRWYDREYTRAGTQYHRFPPHIRDEDLDTGQHFLVKRGNDPNSHNLPKIIDEMRAHDIVVRRAKRALHGDIGLLTTLINEAEELLDPLYDKIEQIKRDLVVIERRDRRERPEVYEPGTNRSAAIGDSSHESDEQCNEFHAWAMELKEVKVALLRGHIVEANVNEFISSGDERFIIEDPYSSGEEESQEESTCCREEEEKEDEENPDQTAVRRLFGPLAAVQLT